MKEASNSQVIRDLIDRLSRLHAAEDWKGPLNPSQFAALAYLARANRFSRAPSHVADYLVTTRGTASQTLKALARKDLISETRSDADKRSIRYDLTDAGSELLDSSSELMTAIEAIPPRLCEMLAPALKELVRTILHQRGGRSFGVCRTCKHHQRTETSGYCRLLNVALSTAETGEICHEHEEA